LVCAGQICSKTKIPRSGSLADIGQPMIQEWVVLNMQSLHYAHHVPPEYYEALEAMFYFNPNQSKHYHRIAKVIEKYGAPKIVKKNGRVSLSIEGLPDCQCLFAFYGPKLAGAMIYHRPSKGKVILLHLAVEPSFTAEGPYGSVQLMNMMIDYLRALFKNDEPVEIYFAYIGQPVVESKSRHSPHPK
jgi:hypothetical protein